MQAFLLIGSLENQQIYIQSFQKEHAIPSYYVTTFEEFKIAQARDLQKILSLKLKDTEHRLISIASPTLEAQQALLKTIEELPSGNFLFFLASSKDDLLPTIQSRCTVIQLEKETASLPLEDTVYQACKENRLEDILTVLGENVDILKIGQVVLGMRKFLLREGLGSQNAKETVLLLKRLHRNYKLSKSNNINKKMALEDALLGFS